MSTARGGRISNPLRGRDDAPTAARRGTVWNIRLVAQAGNEVTDAGTPLCIWAITQECVSGAPRLLSSALRPRPKHADVAGDSAIGKRLRTFLRGKCPDLVKSLGEISNTSLWGQVAPFFVLIESRT